MNYDYCINTITRPPQVKNPDYAPVCREELLPLELQKMQLMHWWDVRGQVFATCINKSRVSILKWNLSNPWGMCASEIQMQISIISR